MLDPIEENCARIFRGMLGTSHPINDAGWDDQRLLAEPLEAIEVDSLNVLDFVMQVEDTYGVELDEAAVNRCRTIGDVAAMVAAAKR
jgi:acyl carrier protein